MNPYIDNDTPPPKPVASSANWLTIALLIAVAGVFLPPAGGWKWETLPIPPYVEPTPDVDPAKTEGAWVIVVEETADRTPAIAAVLDNTPYWLALKSRGLNWRFYDVDRPEAAPYLPLAESVGLPAVLVVGSKERLDAKLLAKFPLPSSTDELDAKIREVTAR